MMSYIYHLVPPNFTGTVLYPLNELLQRHPEIYAAEVQKYAGRSLLLEREIPILNCLWNDVLHFSPVPPQKIRTALLEAGFAFKTSSWFEIDPEACGFNTQNAVIYLSAKRERGNAGFPEQDFEPYSPEKLTELTGVPAKAQAYYQEAQEEGERPLMFNHIPHVLFRGMVATEQVKVIKV